MWLVSSGLRFIGNAGVLLTGLFLGAGCVSGGIGILGTDWSEPAPQSYEGPWLSILVLVFAAVCFVVALVVRMALNRAAGAIDAADKRRWKTKIAKMEAKGWKP